MGFSLRCEDDGENCTATTGDKHVYQIRCAIVYGFIFFLGIVLNAFTIAIIIQGKRFAKSVQIQLLSVAVADMVGAALFAPSIFTSGCLMIPYPDSDALCKIQMYLTMIAMGAGVLGNTAISLERLVAVCYPLKMLSYRRRHVLMVVGGYWIFSFIVNIDIAYNSNIHQNFPLEGMSKCIIEKDFSIPRYMLTAPLIVAKVILPSIVMVISYLIICIKLRRNKKVRDHLTEHRRRHSKMIVMLAVDAMLVAATWFIYFTWVFLDSMGIFTNHLQTLQHPLIFTAIPLINCFITPIVYLTFNKDFRADSKDVSMGMIRKLCCRQPSIDKNRLSSKRSVITIIGGEI